MGPPGPSFTALSGVAFHSAEITQELSHFHQELAMYMKSDYDFVSGSRENEPSKRRNSIEGQDMISNLPDVIIGHILSFLPTKDAVRTSVLSKRWIRLWTFITKLSFGDRDHYSSSKKRDRDLYSSSKKSKRLFLNFVCRVLLHLNSSSIESFSVAISDKYDPYHVDKWISSVVSRNVKRVDVCSRNPQNLSFDSLFKCQSLEELVFLMDYCVTIVRVPSYDYCLASLTVLKLSGITFTCSNSKDSEMLTLSFPVLRKYETKNCTWANVKGVTIAAPLLEVVLIEYKPVLICSSAYTTIKFCASHLTEFTYIGYILPGTPVLDLSAAHIASAKIVPYRYEEDGVDVTTALTCLFLKRFHAYVECLKLQHSEVLSYGTKFVVHLPAFVMLSHLELDIVTGEILLALLQNSPSLETLVLKRIIKFDKELLFSAIVPDCFLSTLRMVKFETFRGDDHELNFAKFVMENTLVLEKISVFPTWMLCGLNLDNVKEKLFAFRKSSSLAIIEICTV